MEKFQLFVLAATYFPLFCRVSSAQLHLTSGFGMGPGGSTAPSHQNEKFKFLFQDYTVFSFKF